MPATGPQYNTYQIPELVLSDTFNEWYTLTNNDIIDKLNRLKAYTVGTTGDGISAGIADDGTLNIEIDNTVKKNMNFDGNVVFNGAVTTINSQQITIDDYNIVLGATASGATPTGISSAGGGGLLIKVKESPTGVTASWLYKVVPVDGINNLDANYFASSEHILAEAGKRFLSGDQKILLGNTTDSEAIQISFENTDLVSPAGGVTGSYKDIVFRYAGTSAGNLAGSTLEAFRISDDGRVKFVSGVHHKRITQNAHGLSFGHVVYLPTDGSGYTAGLAATRETSEVIGVVSNVIGGNTFDIQFGGEIVGNFGGVLQTGEGPNLNAGSAYFLSTSEVGKMTGSAPTVGGQIRKPVMVGLDTNKALIVNYLGGELVDAAEAASQGASNQVTFLQEGHTFKVGDVIRWDSGTSLYVKAQSNTPQQAETIGIIIETPANSDADQFKVATSGYITGISGLLQGAGLSAGAVYYLSTNSAGNTTDASLTLTPPNTIGFVEKPMFFATAVNSGFVYNYRGSVNTGTVNDTDVAPEVLGRTFVPVDGPAKHLGTWYREGFDRNHTDSNSYREQHKNSGILMTDIDHHYEWDGTDTGAKIGKRMASVFHLALDGNTASNPTMLNREGLAHVWDNNIHPAPYSLTSFPNASGYAIASGMDEYNTHRWRDARDESDWVGDSVPIVSDQLNMLNAGNRFTNIDYDFHRLTIPSNATHALIRVFTNVNTDLNSWTATYAAKYDKELIEGDGSGWITKGNLVNRLDPSAVTNEEEQAVSMVVQIDPDAEGSHLMFAVVSNWQGLKENGTSDADFKGVYSEFLLATIEGFYVQDPTVLLPKPFGSYRNSIINGNFDIWQRGNTFGDSTSTGTLTNSLAKLKEVRDHPWVSSIGQRGGAQANGQVIKDQAITADRWRIKNRASDTYYIKRQEFDWSDSSSVLPSGAAPAKYYIEQSVEETSDNNQGLSQRIEDITSLNDEQVTLSFYYKRVDPDAAGAIAGSNVTKLKTKLKAFVDGTGSHLATTDRTSEADGGPWSATAMEFDIPSLEQTGVTVNLNDTWTKYTHTFSIPSIVGKVSDGGTGIVAGKGFWEMLIQPSQNDGTSWKGSVHIAQVQLEKGRRATQFDQLPPETVLQRCQRYYQKSLDMDIVPGSSYFDIKANHLHGGLPDDAALDSSSGTVMGYNDAQAHFHMPGTVAQTHHDSSIGSGFYYRSIMRNTPEVLIYNPYTGTRGKLHSNDDLGNGNSGELNVLWIEGIARSSVGVVASPTTQTPPSVVTYYWTADAEI